MWTYTLFPQILNMSLTASIVIVFVLLARLLLKKAPKIFSYVLWAVVLFRLLCPVSVSSEWSLLNIFDVPFSEAGSMEYIPTDIVHTENPKVNIPIPGISEAINENLPQGEEQLVADPLEASMAVATLVWLVGMLALLLHSIISLIKLCRKLIGAVHLRDNVYLADHITSPFVMGLLRPKIYLPSTLTEQEQGYIIQHEQHHIRRFDPIIKVLAFAALCVHWFNPLVWLAFVLSGKDMEMSCDEAVMKAMDGDIRAEYSTSLLSLATGRKIFAGTPLAFGEGNTKSRIKNVMNYKRPTFWLVAIAFLACLALAICFATNPAREQLSPTAFFLREYSDESEGIRPVNIIRQIEDETGNTLLFYFNANGNIGCAEIEKRLIGYRVAHASAEMRIDGSVPAQILSGQYNTTDKWLAWGILRDGSIDKVTFYGKEANIVEAEGLRLCYMIGTGEIPMHDNFQFINEAGDLVWEIGTSFVTQKLTVYVWKEDGKALYSLFEGDKTARAESDIKNGEMVFSDIVELNTVLENLATENMHLYIAQMYVSDFSKQELKNITDKIEIPVNNYSTSTGLIEII